VLLLPVDLRHRALDRQRQAVHRQGNRQRVRRLRAGLLLDNSLQHALPHQAALRQGNRQHVRQHVPGPELGHVPRLRARAPFPASIAIRYRAESAPALDSSPRCPTGSSQARRSCPAHVPRHRLPVSSQLDLEVVRGPEGLGPEVREQSHLWRLSQLPLSVLVSGRLSPRSQSPLARGRRLPADHRGHVLQERAHRASGRQCVPPHIVRQLAILRDPGIPGIPATRVIAQVIGGVGPQPRPSPVGSSTVGPIRSTTDTDREARSTTRTMWSS